VESGYAELFLDFAGDHAVDARQGRRRRIWSEAPREAENVGGRVTRSGSGSSYSIIAEYRMMSSLFSPRKLFPSMRHLSGVLPGPWENGPSFRYDRVRRMGTFCLRGDMNLTGLAFAEY